MKLKHVAICLSAFAIFAISFNAFAEKKAVKKKMSNSGKAKMILEKAIKTMYGYGKVKTYTAISSRDGLKSQIKTWGKFNPDGTILVRCDIILPEKSDIKTKSTSLFNKIGAWLVLDKFAIKKEYQTIYKPDLVPEKISKTNQYSFKTINDDDPYYLVTEKIITEGNDKDKIALKQYSILKTNAFPFCKKIYDINGKLIESVKYKEIKINIPLKNSIFQVPDNLHIKKAKTAKNMGRLITLNDLAVANETKKFSEAEREKLKKYYKTIENELEY